MKLGRVLEVGVMIGVVSSIAFGFFTLIMLVDQLKLIKRNTGTIDRKSNLRNSNLIPKRKTTFYENLSEVMGSGVWVLPLSSHC